MRTLGIACALGGFLLLGLIVSRTDQAALQAQLAGAGWSTLVCMLALYLLSRNLPPTLRCGCSTGIW
ncbi:MAG: hypothetical protein RLW61_00870 [Gammaproteobacteria bacterium]